MVLPSDQDGCTAVLSLTWDPMGNSHKPILSGTSSSIRTKLWWNSHWMVLFQNCVWQSHSSTKMAATVQLRCYWKQLWSRWAITGSWEPLVNIYYRIFYELWTFADFDRLCKLEKMGGGMKLKKIFSSETTEPISIKLLLKWLLGGPLPKLCQAFQNPDQDGHHSRT